MSMVRERKIMCHHTRNTHISVAHSDDPALEVIDHGGKPASARAVQWCPDCGALGIRDYGSTCTFYRFPGTADTPRITNSAPGYADDLDRFHRVVRSRMRAGQREYGDRSFSRDPKELALEIQEELADVSGWASIMWQRLEQIIKAL